MLSRVAAVMAGLVAVTRGTDDRRLNIRQGLARRRHREAFDDLARDSRLEHQDRVDSGARRVRTQLRRRAFPGLHLTEPATADTAVRGDR